MPLQLGMFTKLLIVFKLYYYNKPVITLLAIFWHRNICTDKLMVKVW